MSMSDTVQNGAATDALDNKKDEIVQIDKVHIILRRITLLARYR